MAEEFPSFDLGFDFLNDQNNKEEGKSSGEAAIGQKTRFVDVTETEKHQLLLEVQVKATKSATNWAVNAFKGKDNKHTNEVYITLYKHRFPTLENYNKMYVKKKNVQQL